MRNTSRRTANYDKESFFLYDAVYAFHTRRLLVHGIDGKGLLLTSKSVIFICVSNVK